MKKLTYEFVRGKFEKDGYELLSKEYTNAQTKLAYRCPEGHEHSITWGDWYIGKRCPYCAGNGKPPVEFIESEFAKEGYLLLTKKYTNNRQKLEYICPNNHIHGISWNSWQQGNRCSYCANNGKPIIEFIRAEFEKEGYVLLTKEYINSKQKLEYRCSKGHEHIISWNGWWHGYRCPECYYLSIFGFGNPSWKDGISCEPYCDAWADKEYKADIKARDNYECQNPDCWGTGKKLCLHHIDYNKKNCGPYNLITLCNSCNARANKDREKHKIFYRRIMEKNKVKQFVVGI